MSSEEQQSKLPHMNMHTCAHTPSHIRLSARVHTDTKGIHNYQVGKFLDKVFIWASFKSPWHR